MKYESVPVRLPNGEVRKAELMSSTRNGYRSARVSTPYGRVSGRITARHGFRDGRVLTFEVRARDAVYVGAADKFIA